MIQALLSALSLERGVGVGIYLGQQPPAELARLKAELAETLIANFCYPRFFDYRTNTLRMRPVDRSKRQEVWTFLSSYDFGPWNRIDVLSPEFQRQVERLLIQYVQRNRAFFGEQGRKRMTDVRALIGSSSLSVADGLRGHLTGRRPTHQTQHAGHPFGSPRPVVTWSNPTISADLPWEQVSNATLLLQQQLLDSQGKIPIVGAENGSQSFPTNIPNSPVASPTYPHPMPPRRSPRNRPGTNGSGKVQAISPASPYSPSVRPTPLPRPVPPREDPIAMPSPLLQSPIPGAKPTNPLEASAQAKMTVAAPSETPPPPANPSASPQLPVEQNVRQNLGRLPQVEDVETQPISGEPAQVLVEQMSLPAQVAPSRPPQPPQPPQPQLLSQPSPMPPSARELSRVSTALSSIPSSGIQVPAREDATILVNDEDVVIFEQLRHQLTVWLRVEAIHEGLDIADKSPIQLIDALRSQPGVDETRLQVVTTLLHLTETVNEKRQATLLDYKQAMMFYLMHTRNSRSTR